jgi:hypothetical protein
MDQTSNGWNDKRPEDLVHRAEQLLNNAQAHPEMIRAMTAYGYDQERWDYGRSPVETAKDRKINNFALSFRAISEKSLQIRFANNHLRDFSAGVYPERSRRGYERHSIKLCALTYVPTVKNTDARDLTD